MGPISRAAPRSGCHVPATHLIQHTNGSNGSSTAATTLSPEVQAVAQHKSDSLGLQVDDDDDEMFHRIKHA